MFDLVKRAGQRLFGNIGVVAIDQQGLTLAFEFLDEIHLQVGTTRRLKDLEQRDECRMVLELAVAFGKIGSLFEQILEAQQCTDALVERIFVGDHAIFGMQEREIPLILSHLQANLNSLL